MIVKVRLFAALREIVGTDELEVEPPDDSTVGDLWDQLVGNYPDLKPYGSSIQYAVNHDFTGRETKVASQDEIAFLPPVSGG